ncbi:MAG TPA: fumarylacetoacetate hydrolase family protein, partial [Anaerolineales bacterium]|nr:fumarylacetoacetate hydrolase family protein [Anaerolineales bacterium]
MKYLTFAYRQAPHELRPGVLHTGRVFDLNGLSAWAESARGLPSEFDYGSLFEVINAGPAAWQQAQSLLAAAEGQTPADLTGPTGLPVAPALEEVLLYPPLPRPLTLRDFYAFEGHVAAAHANRGKNVPPEWYRFPVFYFSNPNSVYGHGEQAPYPARTQALDYELEVACVIGQPGVNIP